MIESLPPAADAYPAARNAVAFHERPGGEGFWQDMRDLAAAESFGQVFEAIVWSALVLNPAIDEEMKSPDFVQYVKAKLGMM